MIFDLFQIRLYRFDQREIAVHHRVHQGIGHESCALLEQFGFSFTTLTHAQEILLATVTHRQHKVSAHKHRHFAYIHLVLLHFQQVHHHKHDVAVLFNFGALVASRGVFDRQGVQVELFLHLCQLSGRRISQSNPNETVRFCQPIADVRNGDVR